jgi:hypothetical protein
MGCGSSTSTLQSRPQLSDGSDLDRQAAPFRGGRHRRPGGPKKSSQERRNICTYALRRKKEGRARDHERSRSSTDVLAHIGQKEQARDEFPFRIRLFDTTAQRWLLWLAGTGVKRGSIAPQGNWIRTKRETLSHSVAVVQGRFRNSGY